MAGKKQLKPAKAKSVTKAVIGKRSDGRERALKPGSKAKRGHKSLAIAGMEPENFGKSIGKKRPEKKGTSHPHLARGKKKFKSGSQMRNEGKKMRKKNT